MYINLLIDYKNGKLLIYFGKYLPTSMHTSASQIGLAVHTPIFKIFKNKLIIFLHHYNYVRIRIITTKGIDTMSHEIDLRPRVDKKPPLWES